MNIYIINCFDTYEHRVDLLYKAFQRENCSVKVITSDFRHIEKVRRTDSKKDFVFVHAKPYFKNMSVQRLLSHHRFSRDVFHIVAENIAEIDVIWILLPPNSFAKDAAKLKKRKPNIKIIFDLIDLWPETMPVSKVKNIWPFSLWKNLRDRNLRAADYVVTECSLYRNTLKDVLRGIRTETVYLAKSVREFVLNPQLKDDRFSLCYLGSINNIVDIPVICEVITVLGSIRPVELHIIGDGEKKEELIGSARRAGASVLYHGKIFDAKQKQEVFDQCHFGLNIMKSTVCIGLTMKSMDYFEGGLPMINNIKGDTWEAVVRFKVGLNYPDDLNAAQIDRAWQEGRKASRLFFENMLTEDIFFKKVDQIFHSL